MPLRRTKVRTAPDGGTEKGRVLRRSLELGAFRGKERLRSQGLPCEVEGD